MVGFFKAEGEDPDEEGYVPPSFGVRVGGSTYEASLQDMLEYLSAEQPDQSKKDTVRHTFQNFLEFSSPVPFRALSFFTSGTRFGTLFQNFPEFSSPVPFRALSFFTSGTRFGTPPPHLIGLVVVLGHYQARPVSCYRYSLAH